MRIEKIILIVLGITLCIGVGLRLLTQGSAQATQAASLAGKVTSEAEGPMEGVLVSAKGVGGKVSVTVVSDNQGHYEFPQGRLSPGNYRIAIRAVGYDLGDPGSVQVVANKTVNLDLKLQKARNLAPQLQNAEWLMSIPGTPEQKASLGCVSCHSLATPLSSRYNATEFVNILARMRNHATGSNLLRPTMDPVLEEPDPKRDQALATYLSSINLSASADGKWGYEFKTLPRPKGKATRVIITEYDLPRPDIMPHDVGVAPDGTVWYGDFGGNILGRLDPMTGETKEWTYPLLKLTFPPGANDVKIDQDGNPWLGLLRQGGIAKFDRKTEKFTEWSVPPEQTTPGTNVGMIVHSPTGMVWFKASSDRKIHGLNLETGKVTASYSLPPAGFYGMEGLPDGNVILFGLSGHVIGVMDAKTGKVTTYPTPTPKSGPRRGDMDAQGRAWFAYNVSGGLGMFDPVTKQFKEWAITVPYADPYDLVVDRKHGDVWAGGERTDYVYRLNPSTGEVTNYLLPTVNANFRRLDMNWNTTPVSVWVGENEKAKIARIEPLE